jgi:hypothetical protein
MLMSLDPAYRPLTAIGFQALLCAPGSLSTISFWYLDEEELNPNFAFKVRSLNPGQTSDQILARSRAEWIINNQIMATRINARFKGLIELPERLKAHAAFENKVDFLHRTVKDFLMTRDCQTLLSEWISEGFEIYRALAHIQIAELKDILIDPSFPVQSSPVVQLASGIFHAAK